MSRKGSQCVYFDVIAGLVYPSRGLADAANHLLSDADLRITLGNNGRTWAQKHYDWSVIRAKFSVLFQELIVRPDIEA